MDRAMKNLYARVFGALGGAALLMHAGQHVATEYPDGVPWYAWLALSLFFVGAVAAAWAQARLNAKRPALWTALVLTGLVPVGAFLYHRAPLSLGGGYGVILLLALVFGAATTAFCAWLLVDRRAMSG